MRPHLLVAAVATLFAGCATGVASRPPGQPASAAAAPARDAEAALERGRLALAEGRRADALAAYDEAARLAPEDRRAHLGLARVRLAEAALAPALADAGRAVEHGGGAEALQLRGRILGTARHFDEAAADLERAVDLEPASAEGWALLAAVQVNRGDDLAAARAFGEAARLAGRDPAVERVWSTLFGMAPDPAQPQEALDRCLRGRAAQLDGRWEEALREQTAALRYTRTFYWCGAGIAESMRQRGDRERAEALYRAVVSAFPERQRHLRADAQGRLAALLLELGRPPQEAVALAREALEVRGERAAVLDTLARACQAAGDLPCARDARARLLRRPSLPAAMRSGAEGRLPVTNGGGS